MFRHTAQSINLALRRCLILPIRLYQYCISPLLGARCRFSPSCSTYAIVAIERHGVCKGCYLAVRRLLKCHPLHPGGADPVPKQKR